MELVSWQIRLFKKSRATSAAEVAPRIHALCSELGKLDRGFAEWFARDRGYRIVPARRPDEYADLLEAARIDWDASTPPRHQPTHSLRFFVTTRDPVTGAPVSPPKGASVPAVVVSFTLDADSATVRWGHWVEISLGTAGTRSTAVATESLWKAALEVGIRALQPDWGVCGTTAMVERITPARARPQAGWLTYMRALPAEWRAPAPPAETMALGNAGWVIAAHPGPPGGAGPTIESVAAVQRALDGVDAKLPPEAPRPAAFAMPSAGSALLVAGTWSSKWAGDSTSAPDAAPPAPGASRKPAFSLETGDVKLPLKAALPFQKAPSPPRGLQGSATFGIEQYAALRAELDVYPEHKAAVRLRYGIEDDEALQRVERQFEAQLLGDPALQERYISLRTLWAAGLRGAKAR